jgi:VWFA-related protein
MRALRWLIPAVVAALAAFVATPVFAADSDTAGVEVVEAGSALFPDRAYVMTFPAARGQLAAGDMKVTEDGRPVTGLSVQSAAAANGIGTVLLIDSSNSMKGSIASAMAAARAFTARNPGQPLSVVFFNSKPRVALPLTTDRDQVQAALAKAPKLGEGTHIYDALAAAVAQVRGSALGGARIVLLSDGDDVGSATSLDAALQQLEEQNIRVYTVGIESGAFSAEDLQRIADDTGGEYAAASSPDELTEIYDELGFRLGNEYLLRYKSAAAPDENVDVNITVDGYAEPVSFSYTTPSTGTAAPYEPAFKDELMQSWVLIPLLVVLVIGLVFLALRFVWNLRTNKALVARLGEFVTLPAEQRAAERRKEVDMLLAAAAGQKQRRRSFRWIEGFEEDVDVGQINHDARRLLARPWRDRRGPLRTDLVLRLRDWHPRRAQHVRAHQGASPAERVRGAASREPRRSRLGSPRRPQPRVGDERRGRRGARALGSRVHAGRDGRAARDPPRRGAGGDRKAHAEHRHGPGRRPRARSA